VVVTIRSLLQLLLKVLDHGACYLESLLPHAFASLHLLLQFPLLSLQLLQLLVELLVVCLLLLERENLASPGLSCHPYQQVLQVSLC
jgi:hypothetical protein